MENKIIIMGADHHNALGLIRSLGRRGLCCDVILVGPVMDGFVQKSKFVNAGHRCKTPAEAVSYLRNRYKNDNVIVLTASDDVAVEVDRVYDELLDNIRIPNAKGRLPYWVNKQSMCTLAEQVGLTVPKHFTYNKGDSLPNNIIYPCITKAISSIDGTKLDTHICYSEEELSEAIKRDGTCRTLIVEQFIEKEFEFQFIGLSLKSGEEIIIPGHSHIDWPEIENTNYFPYKVNDRSFQDTLEKTKEFIKETQYSGFFSVEFLRGKDGKDYFLEMNFRNDGNAICATDSGYNLPYIWYLYNSNGDYKSEIINSTFHEVAYCPELVCTYQMLAGKITFLDWWGMIKHSDSYTIYCPGDNLPLWYNLRANMRGFVSSIVRRILHIK